MYSAHCHLFKSVSMYCLCVNCFCTVWSMLSIISLTKAHVHYFCLNESTPPSYCYKHEPRQTGRGGGVATIYSDILNVTQKTGYRFDSFEIRMLNVTLSDKQNKSVLSLALATVYRPFLKEFADFLSDLLVNVDKALIVGDFNVHVDNTNDALGLAFTDLINSFGVKQNVIGPTHRFNHTLDLIISHGIDLTDINIVPQSNDVTDHFLILYYIIYAYRLFSSLLSKCELVK